jgi:hypothetical protein
MDVFDGAVEQPIIGQSNPSSFATGRNYVQDNNHIVLGPLRRSNIVWRLVNLQFRPHIFAVERRAL